jgi:ATP-dependent DNA helicase RecG
MKGLLERISLDNIPDRLPEYLRKEMQLVGIDSAYRNMHQPNAEQAFIFAKKRFVFEELFLLQLEMILRKGVRKRSEKGFVFSKSGDILANFYHNKLPFDLTQLTRPMLRERFKSNRFRI